MDTATHARALREILETNALALTGEQAEALADAIELYDQIEKTKRAFAEVPDQECMECGQALAGLIPIDGHIPPGEYALPMCPRCGAIYGFDSELRLRVLADAERRTLAGDTDRMRQFRARHIRAHFYLPKAAAVH